MEFNRKDFTKVCVTERLADEMFQKTKVIYEFLKTQNKPLFPIEIAEATGFVYHSKWSGDSVLYHQVVKSLYWLYNMGLIDRVKVEEKITIPTCGGHYKEETMEYKGRIWTTSYWVDEEGTKEITSVRYKWFAK